MTPLRYTAYRHYFDLLKLLKKHLCSTEQHGPNVNVHWVGTCRYNALRDVCRKKTP